MTVSSMPQHDKIGVTVTKEFNVYIGSWYYEFLEEPHRSGALTSVMSSPNWEKIKNLLHGPTLKSYGFCCSCDEDKNLMIITPQKVKITMREFVGSCEVPLIKMIDLDDSDVWLLQEMWGKDCWS